MKQSGTVGPKYKQIAAELRAKIESGEYPPGSRLPTKADLMDHHHVAVNTVERAIAELREAGLVETAQGAGMFVREPLNSVDDSANAGDRVESLEREVAGMRENIALLQAQLIDLYHSTGQVYPYDESRTAADSRQVG